MRRLTAQLFTCALAMTGCKFGDSSSAVKDANATGGEPSSVKADEGLEGVAPQSSTEDPLGFGFTVETLSFGGIGPGQSGWALKVKSVAPNSPASVQGVAVGMQIKNVNGASLPQNANLKEFYLSKVRDSAAVGGSVSLINLHDQSIVTFKFGTPAAQAPSTQTPTQSNACSDVTPNNTDPGEFGFTVKTQAVPRLSRST